MNQHVHSEDEIDLVALLASLYKAKSFILKMTLGFMVIGLCVALFSKVTFKAETTFVPQTSEKQSVGSSLSGLAALAGVNLGSMESNQIPPSLYPTILESTSFNKAFLNATIELPSGETVLVKNYLKGDAQQSWMGSLVRFIKTLLLPAPKTAEDTNSFQGLDDTEYELSKTLQDLLAVEVNEKEGFVNLSLIDKDPYMAAALGQKAFSLLEQTVISFKIENAKKLFDYVSEQYSIKEKEFEANQKELALFSDRNKNITTALFDSERQRLQTKYDLSYALYQELAKQKAQAELQLSKDTPIFSIIKPMVVPKEKEAPKRSLILVIYTFLGGVLSVGFVLVKTPLQEIAQQIRSKTDV